MIKRCYWIFNGRHLNGKLGLVDLSDSEGIEKVLNESQLLRRLYYPAK
jgi:hypothetical protein